MSVSGAVHVVLVLYFCSQERRIDKAERMLRKILRQLNVDEELGSMYILYVTQTNFE